MNPESRNHLESLRKALMALAPTGARGFEGLLAAALSTICNQPFRLASSGSQRGRDGDSSLDEGAITLEGKRYNGALPLAEIAVKLMQLATDNQGQVDTWICGATTPVSAQNAEFLRDAGARQGINVVLLDWSETTLPPLAILLAMAGESAKDFIRANVPDDSIVEAALTAIDHIAGTNAFAATADSLRETLCSPSIGLGLAKDRNRKYLESVFSNRVTARQVFGQPLAPRDPRVLAAHPRDRLTELLKPAFAGPPEDTLLIVVGQEGSGKSWIVASSWLESSPASLLVVLSAERLNEQDPSRNIEKVLIDELIRQTDELDAEASRNRWRRRFAGWRANPQPAQCRIVLWVDGLNQAPRFQWARWIDAASLAMQKLGGRLVVTTRTAHSASIRHDLVSPHREITVAEWTDDEVWNILKTKQIPPDSVASGVRNSLRNPRILGIALELLDTNVIASMHELSIGKLIFEHLRRCNRSGATQLSASEFTVILRGLGQEVVDRLSKSQSDDIKLFDQDFDKRLEAVLSSQFFEVVDTDTELYQIRDEGLQLALAIWLVEEAKRENRNGRDPFDRLAVIMEPIASLDMTSNIVAYAIEVTCAQSDCPDAVTAALIRHFIGLQNISIEYRNIFARLTRHSPKAFVKAAEDRALKAAYVAHFELLTASLLNARQDPPVWEAITSRVSKWLHWYSRSSDQFSTSRNDNAETARQEEWQSKLKSRLECLTLHEKIFLEQELHEVADCDLNRLYRMAFMLLAGMPLADLAPALFAWSFSTSLHAHSYAPHKEFVQLVCLNTKDWLATRQGLIQQIQQKLPGKRSVVGNWTAVEVLRATGDRDDAKNAELLTEELTRDWGPIHPWRLVETYCDLDPCDPASSNPANLSPTVDKFKSLNVNELCTLNAYSSDDHFFHATLPALARFAPDVPIAKLRDLADDVIGRTGQPRWIGCRVFQPHAAALDRKIAEAFATAAQSFDLGPSDQDSTKEEGWLTSQFLFFPALPHLSPNEQLEAVGRLQDSRLLVGSLELLRPAEIEVIDEWLERCEATGDESLCFRIIAAIAYSLPPMSDRAKAIVSSFLTAENKLLRAEAMAIAARTADLTLLGTLIETGWNAHSREQADSPDGIWNGSHAMIAAAKAGLIDIPEAVDRIDLTHYGHAALVLGEAAAKILADRIEEAIDRVLVAKDLPQPSITIQSRNEQSLSRPRRFAILESDDEPDRTPLKRIFGETTEEFHERQGRARQVFARFYKSLSDADARLVLEDIGLDEIKALVSARPDVIEHWFIRLIEADQHRKIFLRLFIIQFAAAIADSHPKKALCLLQDTSNQQLPFRSTYGLAQLPAESWAIWNRAVIPELKSECFRRLSEAKTDQEIAAEVATAFRAGHENLIREYVEVLLATEVPAHMARAIMVSGFSDENHYATSVLEDFHDSKGFIGTAVAAARYAYDRNCWARHWYAEMMRATKPLEFWRFSVLFLKIVDGRIDLWHTDTGDSSDLFQRFFPTLRQAIEHRVKKWQDLRSKKLFGADAPDVIYF
ncbi:MAG: hypothetical protein DHS20C16_12380 [Phycisphaerae bacterium]|nr:MAG: hypothetical protein DHS20C16_12380 [Phycisphaerae bacterium]